jgi:hypothetical protein
MSLKMEEKFGTYPFIYLGLPMGTTKPKVEDFSPLVNKVERRISATFTWLTMAGRATFVDTVVSSVLIYTMCSVKMHKTVSGEGLPWNWMILLGHRRLQYIGEESLGVADG